MRYLFAAIESGIRTTAPPGALHGLLATVRNQLAATTREVIERGKRRRQWFVEFERAARAAFAKQRRRYALSSPPRPTKFLSAGSGSGRVNSLARRRRKSGRPDAKERFCTQIAKPLTKEAARIIENHS